LSLPPSLTMQVQRLAIDGRAFNLAVRSVWGLRAKLTAGTIEAVAEIFSTAPAGVTRRAKAS
jgi:hypothetical protein